MEKVIDLHIHTNQSDGVLSPRELIDYAIKHNINTISITDHDSIDAYTKDLFEYAKKKEIKLITGVEISTKTKKCGIHVLGYNIDINNTVLNKKLNSLKNARHDYLINVSNKLYELGYIVNVEELDKLEIVTKGHIARNVINNNKNKELLIKEFGYVPEMGEFIETIMNEGCKAYIKKETITPIEAAELIREAGGKVVLAHPVAYQYEDSLTKEEIENIIIDMKADGIESYYIYTDRNNKKINDINVWNEIAKKHNLITTIGSDFHYEDNIHTKIGLIDENIIITKEQVDNIIENINN